MLFNIVLDIINTCIALVVMYYTIKMYYKD